MLRLLICAGGTGGGVYPALAVLRALEKDVEAVLWVGSEGGMEADLVQRAGVPFTAVPAAGVHGVGLRALPGNLLRLSRGVIASRRILHQFRPQVLLFTGGYVAVPMALAAARRVPSLLFVPDIEPGLALKTLARFAHTIALVASPSRAYFSKTKAHLQVTGYPTRPDLIGWNREQGRNHLGLSLDSKVLLVAGGSKGALSINRAVWNTLPRLLQLAEVVHLTGQAHWEETRQVMAQLPEDLVSRYHPLPYLHEMGAALTAADLVISRAGASTLGEYPLFGLPAILVPYPFAWRYQKVNADYLVNQGAAVMVKDQALPEQLLPRVAELFKDDVRLQQMRDRMSALARPRAADEIAELVKQMVRHRSTTGDVP
ncbi:undecaprenyldiphospho-muramoylpentapeptide beta-N-acetylglucosaminyltransferase [Anaerolinea thermolimosa]|uniref:undecaprenyldiphospho-muramoylpentapeptide beta-N-acetylglucosaminyltransferase n=1 Tax=Anaerolinea thermolimosa TaxID=229919 RepID=UPI0013B46527|nr:undecaprenyldiphospho-muramoylpentapeptide beta-N-acetylglucosaminyltransferase [Anaerolinea thermolimosa]